MEKAKYSVWLIWIGGAAAMFLGDGWVSAAGRVTLAATFVAHIGEFLAVRSTLQRAGGSMGDHFLQTLIYGLFHWMPIKRKLDAKG